MRIDFVGGTNVSRSVNSSAQRTVNFIVEADRQSKYPLKLIGRPGLLSFVNIGSSAMRGSLEWGGDLYVVIGDTLWKVTTAGSATGVGTIGSVSGTVSMAGGRSYFMIVDGQDGWYCDGSTLTQIADTDFPTARVVTWIDDYFIVDDADNSGRMYRSDSDDPSSWGSLNFATAQRDPDGIVSLVAANQVLWVLGETTTEAWYNDGSEGFSFAPISGGFTQVGALARFSVKQAAGLLFWLGRTDIGQAAVFRGSGNQGAVISTPAVEEDINGGSGAITGAVGDVIYFRGHLLYLLHVPGGKTLVYDDQNGFWSEWKSYGRDDFRGQHMVHLGGTIYSGDKEGSNLFSLDPDTYTDQGAPIECIRADRHIFSARDRRRIPHRRLEIEFESGVGTASLDPQAALRWSDDGGHQWSPSIWRGLGKVGRYGTRAVWTGLGTSRDRIYEIAITDTAKKVLIAGYLEVG